MFTLCVPSPATKKASLWCHQIAWWSVAWQGIMAWRTFKNELSHIRCTAQFYKLSFLPSLTNAILLWIINHWKQSLALPYVYMTFVQECQWKREEEKKSRKKKKTLGIITPNGFNGSTDIGSACKGNWLHAHTRIQVVNVAMGCTAR